MHTLQSNSFTAPKHSTLRIGVVGLGRAGAFFHCRPLKDLENFQITAVFDSRPDVSAQVASDYNCRAYNDYPALLASKEIDLVVIAVPTSFHYAFTMEAIAAGKSVLVEKPFATSVEEAEAMFTAGQKAGVFVGAYHNRRFDPDVLALKDILDQGKLGTILKVSIHLHSYSRRRDWQTTRSMGGGALSNWGAHALDWAFYLFGPHFTCPVARLMHVLNPGDAEDSFHLFLEQANGPSVDIEYFNCAAKQLPKWHVIGRYGTALSDKKHFTIRTCDPKALGPLETEPGTASDGTYGLKEDLGWSEEIVEFGHWDNCPPFYRQLWKHLKEGAQIPVQPQEVIEQMRLMAHIRKNPIRSYKEIPSSIFAVK